MSIAGDPRRAQLLAALAFLQMPPGTRALAALHQWLDKWSGIGLIVVGMERQGHRFSLRKYGNGDGASGRRERLVSPCAKDGDRVTATLADRRPAVRT